MNYIIAFLVLAICCSCASDQLLYKNYELSLKDSSEKTLKFSDVFTPTDIIQLETSDSCILQHIYKIASSDGLYYVLGKNEDDAVFVFNGQGEFIRKIGEQGRGHGEYNNASDFVVDKENGRVVILSAPSKFYVYDLEGKFLFSNTLKGGLLWNIERLADGYVCSTNHLTETDEGEAPFLLYFYDNNFNLQGRQIPISAEPNQCPTLFSSILQACDSCALYYDVMENKVYSVNRDNGTLCRTYNFILDNQMPNNLFKSYKTFEEGLFKYDFVLDALFVNNHVLVKYKHDNKMFVKILSSSGEEIKSGSYRSIFPKMFKGADGEVLLPVNAHQFVKNKNDFASGKAVLNAKDSVNANSNFLILKCRLNIN